MQVVFHIGAHCTEAERLVRSLLKNRDALAPHGVGVPGPGRYRKVLSEALLRLKGAPASTEAQDVLLEAVLDDAEAERVILSNESFISMPGRVLDGGRLYGKAHKAAWLRNAFPAAEVEFALSIRNPASFLPALYSLCDPDMTDAESFLGGADPAEMRWSEMIARLQEAAPDVPLLVWCDEDAPLLWGEILRELAGVEASVALDGTLDLVRPLIEKEGLRRLTRYLERRPPATENLRRRVVAAFLAKYLREGADEVEIDLPGWSEALIESLTLAYDEDVEVIARMPGVTLLTP